MSRNHGYLAGVRLKDNDKIEILFAIPHTVENWSSKKLDNKEAVDTISWELNVPFSSCNGDIRFFCYKLDKAINNLKNRQVYTIVQTKGYNRPWLQKIFSMPNGIPFDPSKVTWDPLPNLVNNSELEEFLGSTINFLELRKLMMIFKTKAEIPEDYVSFTVLLTEVDRTHIKTIFDTINIAIPTNSVKNILPNVQDSVISEGVKMTNTSRLRSIMEDQKRRKDSIRSEDNIRTEIENLIRTIGESNE